jgi:hypothetical protein
MTTEMTTPRTSRQLAGTACAHCGVALVAPTCSEYLSEIGVRHLWVCEGCGYSFETLASAVRLIELRNAAA